MEESEKIQIPPYSIDILPPALIGRTRENVHAILAMPSDHMPRLYDMKGLALHARMLLHSGDYDGAIKEYKRVLNANLTDSETYSDLATCYRLKGDFDMAIKTLKTAIKIAYNKAPLYYNLAHTYRRMGDLEGAIAAVQKAANLDPSDKRYQNAIVNLQAERKKAA